jgi:hypothetical protein
MAIVLANTDETLECGMAESPTTQPDFICSFTDYTTIGKPDRQVGTLADAANTILVASPGADTQRVIETVCVNNRDAAAITLTPHFEEDTTEYPFGTFTVNPGEQLIYTQGKWQVLRTETWAFGRGYVDGLILSNSVDTDHDISISAGVCRDSSNVVSMTGATLVKQIDAAWAAGTAAGGMFTGAVANSTWYHVHAIRKDSDGSVDYGFDTSVTAANKPAGYTYYRRIGAVLTNGSANINLFNQSGDEFLWLDPPLDVNVATLGAARTSYAISTPLGVACLAKINALCYKAATSPQVYISCLDQNDEAPNIPNAAPLTTLYPAVAGEFAAAVLHVRTNASSQIGARSTSASTDFRIATMGYIDFRGKQ